jgi:Na+-driven multidrug efflux pump
LLCFSYGWGVDGLWTGLAVGLIGIGAVLLMVWRNASRQPVASASA